MHLPNYEASIRRVLTNYYLSEAQQTLQALRQVQEQFRSLPPTFENWNERLRLHRKSLKLCKQALFQQRIAIEFNQKVEEQSSLPIGRDE